MEQILSVNYQKSDHQAQDNANYYAKAMPKCEELLGFDMTAKVMFDRACCKSGERLNNAKLLNKEHGEKSLAERLEILGTYKYMGHPWLNEDGDIVSNAIGVRGIPNMTCACWQLKRLHPSGWKDAAYLLSLLRGSFYVFTIKKH